MEVKLHLSYSQNHAKILTSKVGVGNQQPFPSHGSWEKCSLHLLPHALLETSVVMRWTTLSSYLEKDCCSCLHTSQLGLYRIIILWHSVLFKLSSHIVENLSIGTLVVTLVPKSTAMSYHSIHDLFAENLNAFCKTLDSHSVLYWCNVKLYWSFMIVAHAYEITSIMSKSNTYFW